MRELLRYAMWTLVLGLIWHDHGFLVAAALFAVFCELDDIKDNTHDRD